MGDVAQKTGQSIGHSLPTDSLTAFATRVSDALRSCAPAENRKGWVIWLSIQSGLSESTIENLMAGNCDASGPSIDALYRTLGTRFHDAVFGCHGFAAFRKEIADAANADALRKLDTLCKQITGAVEDARK